METLVVDKAPSHLSPSLAAMLPRQFLLQSILAFINRNRCRYEILDLIEP